MGTWFNKDGLFIRYGRDEGASQQGGTYPTLVAGQNVTEIRIANATTITSTPTVRADNVVVPAGATIARVEIIAEEAATSGGSATLDVGFIRLDRSTELDYNGLVAAAALTSFDTKGETTQYYKGSTGAGALIGTELAYPGLVTVNYNTNSYTAGEFVIKIYWYKD